ncbi:winged helix-turn-helix transcriptional regulator [Chachezhania sediminis]|uniref:winged helix-turn-helix transcriptional regulator n=1 Tax=Chachezhania sediminis TaxID=2599291 RepID=UPI00131B904D|nr:winged helix-turn-helix transcriptional regulator [Chachezhania sediminis]
MEHDAPDPKQDMTDLSGPPATSLRRALQILGDPWTMLILKESFNGTRRFSGFQRALNIPKQTLSLRLAALCRDQMMYRRYTGPGASMLDYAPTPKTLDLQDAMYAIWLWHRATPGGAEVLPFDIVHRSCGQVISASYRCTACGAPATSDSVTIQRTQPEQVDTAPRPRLARRNDASFTAAVPNFQAMIAASVVGDLPCNEILYLLFQAPLHLLGIAHDLGLGVSVVRDRLDKLMALGLVAEEAQGRKLLYSVLPRAEGFFPLLLAIADWGDRWCNAGGPPPDQRIHSCGALLRPRYACDHCGDWLSRDTLTIRMHGETGD